MNLKCNAYAWPLSASLMCPSLQKCILAPGLLPLQPAHGKLQMNLASLKSVSVGQFLTLIVKFWVFQVPALPCV